MVVVLTLLSYGCPLQAIVAAFRLDERTVARWQARAGERCQAVHEHLVQQGGVELGHVQADERWVKVVGGKIWMALALVAPEGATHRWIERTPAMAAGLTAHCWTMADLLHYQVPLSPWVAPKHRGRPPKRQETPVLAGAA